MTFDPQKTIILAAVPEAHSGPGWSNTTLSVFSMPVGGGEITVTRLQPDEWPELVPHELFEVGRVAALELVRCVRAKVK